MTDTKKGKIFIAEDNADVGRMYERAFRFSGYEVSLFYDGESAEKNLLTMQEVPVAILLDVMMPQGNGFNLLINIRKNSLFENVPIIILTNSFSKEDEKHFLNAGANLYLIKIENQSKEIVEKVEILIQASRNNAENKNVVQ